MSEPIFVSIDDFIEVGRVLHISDSAASYAFTVLRRQADPVRVRHHETNFFADNLRVENYLIELESLEQIVKLQEFDRRFILQPYVGPKVLAAATSIIPRLRQRLTAA